MRFTAKDRPFAPGWHVTIDGVDVTNRCFEADDEAGYVRVYHRGIDGIRFNPVTLDVPAETLHGQVVLWRDAPAAAHARMPSREATDDTERTVS